MTTHPRFIVLWVLLLSAGAAEAKRPLPKPKPMTPVEQLTKARAQIKVLDFENAAALLMKVVKRTDVERGLKAEAYLELGICQVNMGQRGPAATAFNEALQLDPAIRLSASEAPSIRAVFDAELSKREVAPPPPPMPQVAGVTEPPAPNAAAGPTTTPLALTSTTVERTASRWVLPGVLLGASAAFLAGGIVFAMTSRSTALDLQRAVRPAAEVEALVRQQQTYGVLSVVGYSLAGASAIASVISFVVQTRSAAPVQVSWTVSPAGVTASVFGQF